MTYDGVEEHIVSVVLCGQLGTELPKQQSPNGLLVHHIAVPQVWNKEPLL